MGRAVSEPNVEVEITLSLRPELAARFDGRLALVTPVSRSEVRRLHQMLAAMRDFAALTARSMANFAQLELVRALWSEWTQGRGTEDGLNTWLERCFRVSSLRFLTLDGARKVITALKAMKARAA